MLYIPVVDDDCIEDTRREAAEEEREDLADREDRLYEEAMIRREIRAGGRWASL